MWYGSRLQIVPEVDGLVDADVSIKDEKVGRMLFVLFSEESPLHAENMRQLCTGERVRHHACHLDQTSKPRPPKRQLKGAASRRPASVRKTFGSR